MIIVCDVFFGVGSLHCIVSYYVDVIIIVRYCSIDTDTANLSDVSIC